MALILADGVFDPLHAGHLAYLQACAQLGPVTVQVSPQKKRPSLLPVADRAALVRALGYAVVTAPTTLAALKGVQPTHYAKGADWKDRGVPLDEQAYCDAHGIEVVYVSSGARGSSTALLADWSARMAEWGARELNADAGLQRLVPFNAEAQGYMNYGARLAIEGKHPDILAQLFDGQTVLDVGCGPGHLVQMLRERHVAAIGIDPYLAPRYPFCFMGLVEDQPDAHFDVVICREVLEHVPVREWGALLFHLFRIARRIVYLTTRFNRTPLHPFHLVDERDADPSHITVLPQPFVRSLCTALGGRQRADLELALDWQRKGRVLAYEVPR